MSEIAVFTTEQARMLWQDYLTRQQLDPQITKNFPQHKPIVESVNDRCVILDEDLDAATNSKTGATSGLATVCDWNTTDEEYTETDPVRQITVWNHSESTDHAADTFGYARWIDAHWVFFGDCAAMGAR